MEQKLILFEDTQAKVEALHADKNLALDLCGIYKKVKPILLFAEQFLPKAWKEIVDAFIKLLDAQCHV